MYVVLFASSYSGSVSHNGSTYPGNGGWSDGDTLGIEIDCQNSSNNSTEDDNSDGNNSSSEYNQHHFAHFYVNGIHQNIFIKGLPQSGAMFSVCNSFVSD